MPSTNATRLVNLASERDYPRLSDVLEIAGPAASDRQVRDALAERSDAILAGAGHWADVILSSLSRDTSLTETQRNLVDYARDCRDQGLPEVAIAVCVAIRARRERMHAGLCETLRWFAEWATAARHLAPDLVPDLPRTDVGFFAACRRFWRNRKVARRRYARELGI
jgi:hypothetical protein